MFSRAQTLLPVAAFLAAGADDLSRQPRSCSSVFPRLSCGLSYVAETECLEAGCCFDPSEQLYPCFTPDVSGYKYSSDVHEKYYVNGKLSLIEPSGLFKSSDQKELVFEAVQETAERTHLKISSAAGGLWEVPENLVPRPGGHFRGAETLTTFSASTSSSGEFSFTVNRAVGARNPIFSLMDNIVVQEQYIQFVTRIPDGVKHSFGMGESSRTEMPIGANQTRTLWNSDISSATFDVTLYGSHPFVVQLTGDGEASGYFLLSSNGLEVSHQYAVDGSGYLGVQGTGGVIDLYVFAGPRPTDVVRQYLDVIGRPGMVPYWALGFHNCRWGYENLDHVKQVVANYSAAGIPLETQWIDIDYMDHYLDFTTSPDNFPQEDLSAFIHSLHANEQRFVPIVDPGIFVGDADYDAYASGLEQNVFIKDLFGTENFLGQVWPGPTVFPDWFSINATTYWTTQLKQFHEMVPYDGIWIDMNEVSNFCNDNGHNQVCVLNVSCPNGCCVSCTTPDSSNKYDFPPWVPHVYHGSLGGKTLPMSALHAGGVLEYNAHNMYGFMESIATNIALTAITGERPFLLSRSTFPGSGSYTAHWTGDNAATWADLAVSIVTMNMMALFGIPMVGADICGFIADSQEELCARWIEVGAFSLFSRDHNEIGAAPQELYVWDTVAAASRNALGLRYKLLPHLYSLMYRAHIDGSTVHNALWMHFPEDSNTVYCDGQYMWSDSLLFTPVLEEHAVQVIGYFPKGKWYPLSVSGESDDRVVDASTGGMYVTLDTPLEVTNVHVRGGSVVVMQEAAMTTSSARRTPYTILVALDEKGRSSGALYLDDGISLSLERRTFINYSFDKGTFYSQVERADFSPEASAKLKDIVIRGAPTDFSICSRVYASFLGKSADRVRVEVAVLSSHDITLTFSNGEDIVQNFTLYVNCELN